ncbi:MAG: zf-HC2 domain-containing protein [Bacteroidota bacterium]
MKCTEVYTRICEDLDQDITSPECRMIREHLASCSDCQAYLDSLKKTVGLYRAVPTPRLPRTIHTRLFKVLAALESERRPSSTGRRRPSR